MGLLGELINAVVFVFVQYYDVHIKDVPMAVILQMKRHPEVHTQQSVLILR